MKHFFVECELRMFCISAKAALSVKGYGTTLHPGTRLLMNSAATSAFGRPTSLGLKGCALQLIWELVRF